MKITNEKDRIRFAADTAEESQAVAEAIDAWFKHVDAPNHEDISNDHHDGELATEPK